MDIHVQVCVHACDDFGDFFTRNHIRIYANNMHCIQRSHTAVKQYSNAHKSILQLQIMLSMHNQCVRSFPLSHIKLHSLKYLWVDVIHVYGFTARGQLLNYPRKHVPNTMGH